jgi:hypothetical protein
LNYDQKDIVEFFVQSTQFHDNREKFMKEHFHKSGFALIEKIEPSANILDVGCGKNLFKTHFVNLIGIDPIGIEADYKTCLIDFKTDKKFDVILCLGSIFGSLNNIREQIAHITTMLNSRGKIYWRTQPALTNVSVYPDWFYPWREETHEMLAKEFNFTIAEIGREEFLTNGVNDYRIYAEWVLNV